MWLPLNEEPNSLVTLRRGMMGKVLRVFEVFNDHNSGAIKHVFAVLLFASVFFFFLLQVFSESAVVSSETHLAALLQWEMPAAATRRGKVSPTKSAHVHGKTCRRHVLSRGRDSRPVQTGRPWSRLGSARIGSAQDSGPLAIC